MLYKVGIVITLFLILLLFTKKNKSEADKILAAWLLLIVVHLAMFYIHKIGKYNEFPYLLGFEIPLPLVHSPFLYLYTIALTNQTKNKVFRFIHFLPFLATYLIFFEFLSSSIENKIFVYDHNGIGYEKLMAFFNWIIILQGIIYIFLSFLKLKEYKKNISNQFSNTERINLNWLFYLILGTSFIWLAIIFGKDDSIFSVVTLFVIFIGYFGIKQVGIFTNLDHQTSSLQPYRSQNEARGTFLDSTTDEISIDSSEKVKYEKSKISNEEVSAIHQSLTALMTIEKLYTNPELTLSDLAKRIQVHPNTLSQVINSIEQKNFYDFINHQRIEEFKRIALLPQNKDFTLIALAFECGFNSKTSFNRNFKKATNLSPSEYLYQSNIELS
jgi:AraC-like DNA-binding protein